MKWGLYVCGVRVNARAGGAPTATYAVAGATKTALMADGSLGHGGFSEEWYRENAGDKEACKRFGRATTHLQNITLKSCE